MLCRLVAAVDRVDLRLFACAWIAERAHSLFRLSHRPTAPNLHTNTCFDPLAHTTIRLSSMAHPCRLLSMVSTRSSSASSSSSSKPPSKPKPLAAASSKFPYDLPYASLCLRTHPRLYRTGVGEQGVLMVEPYKSELLPSWRFKDPAAARTSSTALLAAFRAYLEEDDFVGADMARKFIQMGYTRARRYANHTGGKKYAEPKQKGVKAKQIPRLAPELQDPDKVEAARIFKAVLDDQVWTDKRYTAMREEHVQWAKQTPWPTKDDQEVQKAILHDPGQRQVRKAQ